MAKKKTENEDVKSVKDTTEQTDSVKDRGDTKDHPGKGTRESKKGADRHDNKKTAAGSEKKSENTDTAAEAKVTPEEKLAEMQDRYLRLSAEFDNYRKRTLKEKMDLTRTAGENLLLNLLPVMDDFDRAIKVMESAKDCEAMKEGIDLIYNKFQEFFRQNGLKEIDSDNCEFDTDLHEAITKIAAPEEKLKGKVVDTVQKGYYLHDKVIRYSKVVIGE
ncbi:MAG: nucleotide exchange factor GrpE [Bacteroidales bacterium]